MIYFFQHNYLRDRQLDTILHWPKDEILNPGIIDDRKGAQVSADYSKARKLRMSWRQKLPLLNIKMRPRGIPQDAVVYVWGALIVSGSFIVDLDNPWSLVGYNLRAMPFYRLLIKSVLLSDRCVDIRCMSEACQKSLRKLFGEGVFEKSNVYYPYMEQSIKAIEVQESEMCRFLFIGTQFEIKGGEALLRAFKKVYEQNKNSRLDIITHLPGQFSTLAGDCDGVHIHEACFTRNEIHSKFMTKADVLIHPTYVDSFGMVVLEALSYGMAIIATDVYAIPEMVQDGVNGNLISAPISNWYGVMPSAAYYDLENIKSHIHAVDTGKFERHLEKAISRFILDKNWRLNARRASIRLMEEKFAC